MSDEKNPSLTALIPFIPILGRLIETNNQGCLDFFTNVKKFHYPAVEQVLCVCFPWVDTACARVCLCVSLGEIRLNAILEVCIL